MPDSVTEWFSPALVLVDERLAASVRAAVVAWDHAEYGAPAVHPATPFAVHPCNEYTQKQAFSLLLTLGTIGTGPRRFPNVVRRTGPFDDWSDGVPPGWQGRDEIAVDVTDRHLDLLRKLSFADDRFGPVPAFDPKRPLEGRDPVRDLWEAGHGSSWSDDGDDLMPAAPHCAHGPEPKDSEVRDLHRLYLDMPAVLQVFLREASIEEGLYVGISGLRRWRPVDPREDMSKVPLASILSAGR